MKTIQDEVLGEITYNDQLGWYEASIDGHKLYLPCENIEESHQCLAHTQSFLQNRTQLIQEAALFSGKSLLEIKNDAWLEDGEKALSEEQFVARLSFESVTIYPEGSLEFTFDDGDLFWGHIIHASYEDGVFSEAGIAG